MTTASRFARFASRTLVGRTTLDDLLLQYTSNKATETTKAVYGQDGVFGSGYTLTAGVGVFTVAGTQRCTDGEGHIMEPAVLSSFMTNVAFEDSGGSEYSVGLKWNTRPAQTLDNTGVVINPGTGVPEYVASYEVIGEVGDPDSVVDLGGSIRFIIDTVTEPGVSNAGRLAIVYMKRPVASTENDAFEQCTVVWSGTNRITTTGTLGQSVVSTNPADYEVHVVGPTVKRNTSLDIAGYVYLGYIVGGSSVFTDGQTIIVSDLSEINADLTQFASTVALNPAMGGIRTTHPNPAIGSAIAAVNGIVYLFGGADDDAYTTKYDDTITYDVDANTWGSGLDVPYGQYAHMAAVVYDDFIYVAGGMDGATSVDDFAKYNPATNTWTTLTSLPAPRANGALIASDSRLYYIGGIDVALAGTNTTYVYNPTTDLWSSLAVTPATTITPRGYSYGDYLYVHAGDNSGTTWRYNIAANSWSAVGSSSRHSQCAAFEHDGMLLLAGGSNPVLNKNSRVFEAFSPISETWVYLGKCPMAQVKHPAGVVVDGVALIFGGLEITGWADALFDKVVACDLRALSMARNGQIVATTGLSLRTEQYDAAEENDIGPLPEVVAGVAACVYDRSIWYVGGWNNSGTPLNQLVEYHVDTGLIEKHTGPGTNRCQPVFVADRDSATLYMVGGHDNGGNNTAGGRAFDIASLSWSTLSGLASTYISEAGPGMMFGSMVVWAGGSQGLISGVASSLVGYYDVISDASGFMMFAGLLTARRQSVCLGTTRVTNEALLGGDKIECRIWSIGGDDGGGIAVPDMNGVNMGMLVITAKAVLGVTTTPDCRGCTDDRSVIFGAGASITCWGETGSFTTAAGAIDATYSLYAALVAHEGVVYHIGGRDAGPNQASSTLVTNQYRGSWTHYPTNFTTGETGQNVGASAGDVFGFVCWSDRLVYGSTSVGLNE
jgi:N-acetylneuraminic acid mutarotase